MHNALLQITNAFNTLGRLPSLPTHQSPPVESAVTPSQIQISKSTHNTTSLEDRRLPAIDNRFVPALYYIYGDFSIGIGMPLSII